MQQTQRATSFHDAYKGQKMQHPCTGTKIAAAARGGGIACMLLTTICFKSMTTKCKVERAQEQEGDEICYHTNAYHNNCEVEELWGRLDKQRNGIA
jgi:hypothetical protein